MTPGNDDRVGLETAKSISNLGGQRRMSGGTEMVGETSAVDRIKGTNEKAQWTF